MPLNHAPTNSTPSNAISDPSSAAVDSTYDQNEADVITTLRIGVKAILQVLRDKGLIQTAIPYTVTQSSVYAGLTGTFVNLTDGDSATGAGTNGAGYIRADFGSVMQISSVVVAGGSLPGWGLVSPYLNGATIDVSTDGTTWATVATVSGVTDTAGNLRKTFSFALTSARYVRLNRADYLSTTEFGFN